jgi:peptidyl-prolyl cis-trans isomerase A (cyclophilin A)
MSIKNIFFVIVSTIVFIIAASSLLDAARVSTGNPQARLLTQYGIITFELFPENAPKTVANFINLAKTGFYKNAFFYRMARYQNSTPFVIQGGKNNGASATTVPLEYSLPNKMWSVGLARSGAPDSGSSEFFINLFDNSAALAPGGTTLNGYCVFAEVVDGFAVVEAMEKLPVYYNSADGMHEFVEPPTIFKIKINF